MEFFWELLVADFIRIEVRDANTHTMFHFARTKVVQERSPLFVFFEIFSDMLRKQNVTGIAAIHHPLRHIKTGTGKIGLTVHIDHTADRAAVHSHSKFYLWVFFESATDFERAFHWFFRALVKNQRHPVAGGNLN